MSAELLLMMRVCKMYNNDRYVLGVLYVFVGTHCAAMAISARMAFHGVKYSLTCVVVDAHPGQIYYGAPTIAVNLCIVAMMLRRYSRGNWQEPLRSYLKITVRDSICTVIVVTGNYLFVSLQPMRVHRSQTSENILPHVITFSLWFATGRPVLNKERFLEESQNDFQLTEVDLDNLEPLEDSDVSFARPSDSNVLPTKVTTAVDSELGIGTEEDIADRCICDWVDDASLSRCASTIVSMEMDNSGECSCSGSRN
ncbi:hypothetical protein K503DRAFT_800529 [Rhizopogon vinicolor AM-OR11-026]|uniref:Uncharacterized protein n=1 Tax=Rhizopogon vinicolor AM-OR11-026 TaxID=1314800 RepID=A0A1B7N0C8_9AGAM|nr:hypothetical protein K503DRAFT_800529 [Rhizopogon vinicolor AM-OR11-026]